LSIDSLWKVGRKRGWWKGISNGDVFLFVASLALMNAVYEARPAAVKGGAVRKGMGVMRGEGWVDKAQAKNDETKEGNEVQSTGEAKEE
jgi:hypothetical protein